MNEYKNHKEKGSEADNSFLFRCPVRNHNVAEFEE